MLAYRVRIYLTFCLGTKDYFEIEMREGQYETLSDMWRVYIERDKDSIFIHRTRMGTTHTIAMSSIAHISYTDTE